MNVTRRQLASTVAGASATLFRAFSQTPRGNDSHARADGLTREVAEFIVNSKYEDLPKDVLDLGKKSILDALGLALSGSVADTGPLSRAYVKSLGLSGHEASIIGSSMKVPVRFAAFVNGIGI